MSRTTLYILCGIPYAGKSTLTKELAKRYGFKITSMDDIMEEKKMDSGTMTQDDWNEAYSEGYERLKKNLKEGYSTILDLGNLKRSERNTARSIAESLGVSHQLIYINTPVEKIMKRRLRNQETKERGHLEEASMKRALDMFQEPTEDENPITYNQEMDLGRWIKENIETN
jgi:predicted kinase